MDLKELRWFLLRLRMSQPNSERDAGGRWWRIDAAMKEIEKGEY